MSTLTFFFYAVASLFLGIIAMGSLVGISAAYGDQVTNLVRMVVPVVTIFATTFFLSAAIFGLGRRE